MAKSFSHRPNRIMQQRAPSTTDEAIQARIQDMVRAGQLPSGLNKYSISTSENAVYRSRIWFQANEGVWKYERIRKADGDELRLQGTLDEISEGLDEDQQRQVEANDETHQAVEAWLKTKWGKVFGEIACKSAWAMMDGRLLALGLDVSVENLGRAFISLYDEEPCAFERFFQKAARLALEKEASVATTPHENLPSPDDARKSEDNINRAKDLKTLRREAIFGTKGGRTPSTGTVRQPR